MAGVLYVVATPLGNLEDITQRALRVLRECNLIAAEDTRHSRKLLLHYGIGTPLTSYYDEAERGKAPHLVERLRRGDSIALISDAGTPCIADPGYRLISAAAEAGISIVPIPGPSAVAAAISISGLPSDRFAFEGFVPARAVARHKFFAARAAEPRTMVFYETPQRIVDSLAELTATLGDRRIVVCRELTKMYEEVLRGPASEVQQGLAERAAHGSLQGEFVIVVEGVAESDSEADADTIDLGAAIARLRGQGKSLKDAARILSAELGIPRRDIYQAGLEATAAESTDE